MFVGDKPIKDYDEALKTENLDCDCNGCINFIVSEALTISDNLNNISFAKNYLNKFKDYFIYADEIQQACMVSSHHVEKNFIDISTKLGSDIFEESFSLVITKLYESFEGDDITAPNSSEIHSFMEYILCEKVDKFWVKASMFRLGVAKYLMHFLTDAIIDRHDGVFNLIQMLYEKKTITVDDLLNSLPGNQLQITKDMVMQSICNIWFRSRKFQSLEKSENSYISKLEWLFRRIPEWCNDNKDGCMIEPVGISQSV